MSAALAVPSVQAWQIVEDHDEMIQRIVATARTRGVIEEQDRDDAIAEAKLRAFELAQRPDVENFEHLLAYTLHHRLMDNFRPGTDAMDRADGDFELAAETVSVPLTSPREYEPTQSEITQRIRERIPPRIQPVAIMVMIEHLTVTQIAHRTGRSQPGPKAELKKIIKHCIGQVYGREKNPRLLSVESIR